MSQPKQQRILHQTNSVQIEGTQLISQHANNDKDNNETKSNGGDNILRQLLKLFSKNTTKSQHSGKGGIDKEGNDKDKQQQQKQIERRIMPEPLDSEEQHSREVQYLSYIQNYQFSGQSESIGSLDADQTKREKLRGVVRGEFLCILYKCAIYAKKEERLTQTDDDLLYSQLQIYFHQGIYPIPKDAIGETLMANGYFLAAYAIMIGRLHKSRSILTYLLSEFYIIKQTIEENSQQFMSFYDRDRASFNLSEDPERDMRKSEIESYMRDRQKRIQKEKQIMQRVQKLKRQKIENLVEIEMDNQKLEQQDSKAQLNKMKETKTSINQVRNIKKQPHEIKEMRQGNFMKVKKRQEDV